MKLNFEHLEIELLLLVINKLKIYQNCTSLTYLMLTKIG
jgi:hypothetical protein